MELALENTANIVYATLGQEIIRLRLCLFFLYTHFSLQRY